MTVCRTVRVEKINTYPREARGAERRRDVNCTPGWDVPYLGAGLLNSTFNEMLLLKTVRSHEIRTISENAG